MSDVDRKDIQRKGVSAYAWDVSGKLLKQGVTFFVTVLLARILGPEEFGLVAMSMFFVSISTILIDLGLSSSLIQAKEVSNEEYSTIFYLNITIGALIAIVLYTGSEVIARFYDEPRIADIMRLLAINPIIGSLNVVHIAILTREMRFRVQTYASFVSSIVAGSVAITMAYLGYGVWALVIQAIMGMAVQTVIIWSVEEWIPRLHFNTRILRKHLPFSGRMFLAGAINTVYQRVDILIIGKLFSAADLGLYYRAVSFNTMIIRYAGNSLVRVFFPLISKMQDDHAAIRKAVSRSLNVLSLVVFAMSAVLYVSADEIIVLLFTDKWLASAPYLRLAMLFAYAYPMSAILVNVVSGTRHGKSFLRLELYKKAVLTICMPVGFYFGITGYLVALTVGQAIGVMLNFWTAGGIVRIPFKRIVNWIYSYAFIALAAGAIITTLYHLLWQYDNAQMSMALGFAIKTFGVLTVYGLTSWLLRMNGLQELLTLRKRIMK
ncbi:lipopolysaccharide biosynthesis protein [bacterium]|nr:lipopolysaccharide biosynthesis protein [bacterium]